MTNINSFIFVFKFLVHINVHVNSEKFRLSSVCSLTYVLAHVYKLQSSALTQEDFSLHEVMTCFYASYS